MRSLLPAVVVVLVTVGPACAQTSWVPVIPMPRSDPGLAYDAARGRVLMFGGADAAGSRLRDMWEWDGAVWSPRQPATMPPARSGQALTFDAPRNRVVMFGGDNGVRLADTWEWDGADWRLRTTAIAPAARRGHALACDEVRGRVVMFGGNADTGLLADTWEWNGTSWAPRGPAMSPFAREAHALAYNRVRRRTVLFGGATPSGAQVADTWEWDGLNWSQVSPVTNAPRRSHHAMAYDPVRGRVVLSGGRAFGTGLVLGDAWDFNGISWVQQASGPDGRAQHGMSFDERRGRMVVFGGVEQAALGDTWESSGTWVRVQQAGAPPARSFHALASSGGSLLLFGGGGNPVRDDTWTWNGRHWSEHLGTHPAGLWGHALASDRTRGRTVLFGGCSSSPPGGVRAETWEWSGTAWAQRAVNGPSARFGHGLAYDEVLGKVLLFGGGNGGSDFDDTWTWDGASWLRLTGFTSPSPRSWLAMAYDATRSRAVLFGGSNGGFASADTWEWDGATWLQRQPAVIPPFRQRHAMAWDPRRNRIVMGFGDTGLAGPTALGDVWEWDGVNWSAAPSAPVARSSTAMAFDPGREQLLLFGGSGAPLLGDTWAYGSLASYASYGTGCPGTLGSPVLAAANSRPAPGSVLRVDVSNVPQGIAVVTMGFSDTQSGSFTLPLDLGPFGMPGCRLLADPVATRVVTAPGNTVSWTLFIPNVAGLASAVFFNQAFVLDTAANVTGVTASNGGRARLGL